MTKYIALFTTLAIGVACGGTTDSGNGPFANGTTAGSGGGAGKGSSGASNHAGTSSSGSSSGGTSSAGSSSAGAAHGGVATAGGGGVSSGGVSSGGVSSGGVGGIVDARCPPLQPTQGVDKCPAQGMHCEYNQFNQCLCYDSGSNVFGACRQVDPTCTGPSAGTAGAGGATPQPAPFGSGGISAKIAAPSHEVCYCSAGDDWSCMLNIGP